MNERAINVIRDLIDDIEAMRELPRDMREQEIEQDGYWFGGFSQSTSDVWAGETHVEWPNLAISVDAAKKFLDEEAGP